MDIGIVMLMLSVKFATQVTVSIQIPLDLSNSYAYTLQSYQAQPLLYLKQIKQGLSLQLSMRQLSVSMNLRTMKNSTA